MWILFKRKKERKSIECKHDSEKEVQLFEERIFLVGILPDNLSLTKNHHNSANNTDSWANMIHLLFCQWDFFFFNGYWLHK